MSYSLAILAVGLSLFCATQTSAMGDLPGQTAAPLPVSDVTVDGLALPLQSYADDPEMSEAFRKLLPYMLDVIVLQEQCAAEPRYEAAVFGNPVRITPKPDAPFDPVKVAAAQSATEAAMDAYETDRPLRALKVIWSAEDLEAAAFNNAPDGPQSSRARMRAAAKHLEAAGLELGPDGWRRDRNGEIVSLDLMVEAPRLESSCHLNFLKAAVANLKANGIHANARACTLSLRPGEELSEECAESLPGLRLREYRHSVLQVHLHDRSSGCVFDGLRHGNRQRFNHRTHQIDRIRAHGSGGSDRRNGAGLRRASRRDRPPHPDNAGSRSLRPR